MEQYALSGVNSMWASINSYLAFLGKTDCKVKQLKIQRQIFAGEDRELTKEEYRRLTDAAKDSRIGTVIQTICGTGIRVSELRFITAEAVFCGKAVVNCKNKTRIIFIPVPVCQERRCFLITCAICSQEPSTPLKEMWCSLQICWGIAA